jgi:cell division protein FtsW
MDHTILGVPARFMRPRIILLVTAFALIAFGLLMIYSASSITAMDDYGDAAYYLKRQVLLVVIGVIGALVLGLTDYHTWYRKLLLVVWGVTVAALLLTAIMGLSSHGAVRWVSIGPVRLQPSEFAKITIVLTAANLCERFFEDGDIDLRRFIALGAVGVGLPVVLVLVQPDKGSTLIVVATVMVMLYLAGLPGRTIAIVVGIGAALFFAYSLKDDYSRQRFLTSLDPWADPYGDGYQLIQGFYAFGSGGLLGVGIGMSKQKYSYLPEAHNDFIFAIIGEECGLLGTLGVVAGFVAFVWAGFKVARHAPDLAGRLIAAGCTSLIAIQFFVNVLGVLGVTPLTGKPLPFLSYGGSSVITCIMLVGLITSVSRASSLPETVNDRRRRSMSVAGDEADGDVGPVMTRSESLRTPRPSAAGEDRPRGPRNLTLVDGGQRSSSSRPRPVPDPRPGSPSGARGRINLGDSAADRLRPDTGPRVRGREGSGPRDASSGRRDERGNRRR